MRGGVKSRYFEVTKNQAFAAGTQYVFSLADFGMSDITPKGFAWMNIYGNDRGEESNMPRSNGTNIYYTPSVNNSSVMVFKGVVFY
jgi:hypothetical protein